MFRCILRSPRPTLLWSSAVSWGPTSVMNWRVLKSAMRGLSYSMQEPLVGDRLSANEALGILEGKQPRPAGSR